MKVIFYKKIFISTITFFVVLLFFALTPKVFADTETLRPNGAGSETTIYGQIPSSGSHWDKVDEETADDNTTYVVAGDNAWKRDLYALPSHTGSGSINSVTVYARLRDGVASNSSGKISIRTNSTTYDTSAYALTTSWTDKSNVWTTNPQTSLAWTWDEIDTLEAGISLYCSGCGAAPSILKGQPILMADGSQKNIEDIQVGDEIISFNIVSKKAQKDRVVWVGGGPHDDYLIFNGTLKTSLNHVIWATGEFKPAEDIKVGEFLLNPYGQEIEITRIEYVREKVDTYDLEIEKNHNFFASNYLVHNAITVVGNATQVYVVVDYTPDVAIATATATSTSPAIGDAGIDATVDGAANYTASSTVWSGRAAATYVAGETPVAVITLAPKVGYTFAGLLAENITVTGGIVTYGDSQGVLGGGTGVSFTVTYPQLVAAADGGGSSGSSAPAPTISFSASPTSIPTGSSSTLTWSLTNGTTCTLNGLPVAISGSMPTGILTTNTSFGFVCSGAGGVIQARAMVSVTSLQTSLVVSPTSSLVSVGSATSSALTSPLPTSLPTTLPTSIPELLSLLETLKQQLQALIQQALASKLTLSPAVLSYVDTSRYVFTHDLTLGDKGDDVNNLQLFLIEQAKGPAALALKEHGATYFFGPLTRAALAEYQVSQDISPSLGYFGPKTRLVVNGRR